MAHLGRNITRLQNIRERANHGTTANGDVISAGGVNGYMTDSKAALGLSQLDRLDEFINIKKKHAGLYRGALSRLIDFQLCWGALNHWYTAGLLPEGKDPGAFVANMGKRVPCNRPFKPLTRFGLFKHTTRGTSRRYKQVECPVAEEIYQRGVCLPMSTLNTDREVIAACDAIKQFLG